MAKINGNRRECQELEIWVEEPGERLDLFICQQTELNRTRVQKLIKDGLITVNKTAVKPNYKVKKEDGILIKVPPAEELAILPEKISLDVIFEDQDLIVINKPPGLVVHPAAGNYSGTLVNALLAHCGDSLSGINGIIRPGIVHRLDKDTTGLLVVAKNDQAHLSLADQLKNKSAVREYLALVHGHINEPKGVINAPIGRHQVDRKKMAVVEKGKEAVTHYQVMARLDKYTLVKARLETGRTHQIRVHFAFMGHPVVGDPVYGPKKPHFGLTGQLLHAQKLGFIHPVTGLYKEFSASLPAHFLQILTRMK